LQNLKTLHKASEWVLMPADFFPWASTEKVDAFHGAVPSNQPPLDASAQTATGHDAPALHFADIVARGCFLSCAMANSLMSAWVSSSMILAFVQPFTSSSVPKLRGILSAMGCLSSPGFRTMLPH